MRIDASESATSDVDSSLRAPARVLDVGRLRPSTTSFSRSRRGADDRSRRTSMRRRLRVDGRIPWTTSASGVRRPRIVLPKRTPRRQVGPDVRSNRSNLRLELAGKTVEEVIRSDRIEAPLTELDRIQHVRPNRRRRVPADPLRCHRQRVLVQVEKRDLGHVDRPLASVKKPSGANPDVEVARTDVPVVALEHRGARTSPDEAVREPENEVVAPQHERRIDTLAGFDVVGRLRGLIGHISKCTPTAMP